MTGGQAATVQSGDVSPHSSVTSRNRRLALTRDGPLNDATRPATGNLGHSDFSV
jgi:hypothetical protein